MKRLFDILGALVLLLIALPFLFVVIIAIVLIERKSPFFLQERVGKNKQPFTIIKLRTMSNEEITVIGAILRKTGIDELPQLINILKCDMSFVGPRPLTQHDIDRLGWGGSFYQKRWSVRPGIVGLAQLSPVCHKKMSWFYDQLYLNKHSFILDVKILCAAMLIPFTGKQFVKKSIHGK